MTEEIVDFDIDEFLARIHGNKPPFRCPATFCQKICKSYKSIENHMKVHRAPEPIVIPVDFKEEKTAINSVECKSDEKAPSLIRVEESKYHMTYHESKKFIMLDAVDGGERKNKVFRVNIHQPLKLVLEKSDSNQTPNMEKNILDLPQVDFQIDRDYKPGKLCPLESNKGYLHYKEMSEEEMENIIEYDLDEEDTLWLEKINEKHKSANLPELSQESMEWIIDRLEKLSKFQRVISDPKKMQKSCLVPDPTDDEVCAVCLDGTCENSNVILFCDVCNLPVHQECYGVPYIPEGSWLCRKCLHSPSEPVQCCLCPNAGGAFKKTSDERWAHVICGLWIPEVVFANLTFLEPLEDIDKIAPARWKLKCFICKKNNVGACIQCHKSTCYRAFHVTCAQQAGLYMKIEDDLKTGGIKKSVFCDIHCPADYTKDAANRSMYANNDGKSDNESHQSDDDSIGSNSDLSILNNTKQSSTNYSDNKMSQKYLNSVRKALSNKRINQEQAVLLPYVSETSIKEMLDSTKFLELTGTNVEASDRFTILKSAYAFWKLKRALRRGVPLLKRLQVSSRHQRLAQIPSIIESSNTPTIDSTSVTPSTCRKESRITNHQGLTDVSLGEQSRLLHIFRQDLERARLLTELTKKRERVKRDLFSIFTRQIEIQTQPAKIFLEKIIQILQERDKHNMFAEPVTDDIAPSYSKIIKNPMDFSTMKQKCHSFQYFSVADLAKDFHLMMNNCLTYNLKDSIFYKTAQRLRNYGDEILAEATHVQNRIGINPKTGMFYPEDAMSKPMDDDLWRVFAIDNVERMKQLMEDSCMNITIDTIRVVNENVDDDVNKCETDHTPTSTRAIRANRRSLQGETSDEKNTNDTSAIPNDQTKKGRQGIKRKLDPSPTSQLDRPAKQLRRVSRSNLGPPSPDKKTNMLSISQGPTFSSPLTIESGPISKEHFRLGHGSISPTDASVLLAKVTAANNFTNILSCENQFVDRPNFQNYQKKSPIINVESDHSSNRRYSLRENKAKSFAADFESEQSSSSSSSSSDEESCFSSEQESNMLHEHSVSEVDKTRRRSLRSPQMTLHHLNQEIENEKHANPTLKSQQTNGGRQLRKRYSVQATPPHQAHHNPAHPSLMNSNERHKVERSPLSVKNQIIGYSKFSKAPPPLVSSTLMNDGVHHRMNKRRKRKPFGVKLQSYLTKKNSKQKYRKANKKSDQQHNLTMRTSVDTDEKIVIINTDDENTRISTENDLSQESILMFKADDSMNISNGNLKNLDHSDLISSTSPVPLEISVSPLSHPQSLHTNPVSAQNMVQILSSNCSSVDCTTNGPCDSLLTPLTPVWAKCLGSPWYPGVVMNPLYSTEEYYNHQDHLMPTAPKEVLIKGLQMLWNRRESHLIKDYLISHHTELNLNPTSSSISALGKLEKTDLISIFQTIESNFQPFKTKKYHDISEMTEIDHSTNNINNNETVPVNNSSNGSISEFPFLYLILFFDTKNTWQWLPIDKLVPMFSDKIIDANKLKQAKRSRMKQSILKAYTKGLRHFCNVLNVPYPGTEDSLTTEPFILFNSTI